MHLSDAAAPILCSHALHGKERVMACRNLLFRFHGTYLLTSHAVSSSLLTSFCRRKSSHQVFKTFLSGFSSKRFERHRCSQSSSVTNSHRSKTSLSSAVGCNHGWMHFLSFFCAQTDLGSLSLTLSNNVLPSLPPDRSLNSLVPGCL